MTKLRANTNIRPAKHWTHRLRINVLVLYSSSLLDSIITTRQHPIIGLTGTLLRLKTHQFSLQFVLAWHPVCLWETTTTESFSMLLNEEARVSACLCCQKSRVWIDCRFPQCQFVGKAFFRKILLRIRKELIPSYCWQVMKSFADGCLGANASGLWTLDTPPELLSSHNDLTESMRLFYVLSLSQPVVQLWHFVRLLGPWFWE